MKLLACLLVGHPVTFLAMAGWSFSDSHVVNFRAVGKPWELRVGNACFLQLLCSMNLTHPGGCSWMESHWAHRKQGRTQRGFEGVHQIQLGVWGGGGGAVSHKKLFTVISTCTLCQSDGREYSLYMGAWLTVFTWDDALPHWCCPGLQHLVCERSAASTIFSQRLVLNVQNRSKMQHSGRVRSVSCHTSCESVVHCLSDHFRSQATKRTGRRTPWMSELSSRLLKALVWESLP